MNLAIDDVLHLVLVHMWQLTVLIIAVAIANRTAFRRRPHMAYLLWLLVFVKCLTPPLWSNPMCVFGRTEALSRVVGSSVSELDDWWMWATRLSGEKLSAQPVAADLVGNGAPTSTPIARTRGGLTLVIVWSIGAVGLTGLTLLRCLVCFRCLWRQRTSTDPSLEALVERVSRQLGIRRRVRLLVTDSYVSPALIGVVRSRLVLPICVLEGKTEDELVPILAHELIHFRRGDVWVGMLQVVGQIIWWFHPLVWWANRQAISYVNVAVMKKLWLVGNSRLETTHIAFWMSWNRHANFDRCMFSQGCDRHRLRPDVWRIS